MKLNFESIFFSANIAASRPEKGKLRRIQKLQLFDSSLLFVSHFLIAIIDRNAGLRTPGLEEGVLAWGVIGRDNVHQLQAESRIFMSPSRVVGETSLDGWSRARDATWFSSLSQMSKTKWIDKSILWQTGKSTIKAQVAKLSSCSLNSRVRLIKPGMPDNWAVGSDPWVSALTPHLWQVSFRRYSQYQGADTKRKKRENQVHLYMDNWDQNHYKKTLGATKHKWSGTCQNHMIRYFQRLGSFSSILTFCNSLFTVCSANLCWRRCLVLSKAQSWVPHTMVEREEMANLSNKALRFWRAKLIETCWSCVS